MTRLRSALGKDRSGNSTLVRHAVRRIGSLLHHDVPGVLGSGPDPEVVALGRFEWTDTASVPPTPYPETTSEPWGDTSGVGFANPVLTARDVDDYGRVDYLADPFLLPDGSTWRIYFEVFNPDRTPTAVIGRASTTKNWTDWTYDGIVLDTGVHASFPYVFRWEDTVYMTPNLDPEGSVGAVRIYASENGGQSFVPVATPVDPDVSPTDRVVFRWNERWWLFVSMHGEQRELRIYYSDNLEADDWIPHSGNPFAVDKPRIPGGRPIVCEDRILMFYQDGPKFYGDRVHAFEITSLNTSTYVDKEVPDSEVVGASPDRFGWNSGRMHTYDPWYTGDRWVCAVDGAIGCGRSLFTPHWTIGLYAVPDPEASPCSRKET